MYFTSRDSETEQFLYIHYFTQQEVSTSASDIVQITHIIFYVMK